MRIKASENVKEQIQALIERKTQELTDLKSQARQQEVTSAKEMDSLSNEISSLRSKASNETLTNEPQDYIAQSVEIPKNVYEEILASYSVSESNSEEDADETDGSEEDSDDTNTDEETAQNNGGNTPNNSIRAAERSNGNSATDKTTLKHADKFASAVSDTEMSAVAAYSKNMVEYTTPSYSQAV
jgi:uncharacterized protein YfkK (UPF0435 family)